LIAGESALHFFGGELPDERFSRDAKRTTGQRRVETNL